jgi:hypothetical protein
LNEKTLKRYLKVKALVEQGAPGERDAAREALKGLEQRYQGIREAAEKHVREEQAARTAAAPPPPPTASSSPDASRYWGAASAAPGPAQGSAQGRQQGNWENIFRYAQGFYETVKEVVEDASEAYYGRNLAEEEVEFTAGSRDRHIFVRMKVPFEAVVEARELNAVQKETFRQAVHDMMDEYVDAILHE